MIRKNRMFLPITIGIILCLALSGWLSKEKHAGKIDYLARVQHNLIYFGKVYKEVTNRYVELIDPEKLMRIGLQAMLSAMDDYSIMVKGEENAQLQIMTTGRYRGLGLVIGIRDNWPTVMEPPYDNTPAARAGCREGDQIIEVDSVSTEGLTVGEVAKYMRGEIGTAVNISIRRAGSEKPVKFRLVRAEILVKDIEFADMLPDSIGYIKLTRFSKNAVPEMQSAIIGLKNKGIRSLILDLRNNPGGLLESAVGVADIFLPKGQFIVSTRGRNPESLQSYFSESQPLLQNTPLVLLVNSSSASASEIVAGAIQDLDRGIILGQPTFGKGLVQSLIPVGDNVFLKMTTAKYYLPSGRLIQHDRRTVKEKILLTDGVRKILFADSAKTFRTATGREVFGRGGIFPDIAVANDSLNDYQRQLLRQSMLFNFAVDFAGRYERDTTIPQVTEAIIADFKLYLQEKNFHFEEQSFKKLQELKSLLAAQGTIEKIEPYLSKLEDEINAHPVDEFERNSLFIRQRLQIELAAKFGGSAAKIRSRFATDRELKKAIQLLHNMTEFTSILKRVKRI